MDIQCLKEVWCRQSECKQTQKLQTATFVLNKSFKQDDIGPMQSIDHYSLNDEYCLISDIMGQDIMIKHLAVECSCELK